MAYNKKQYQNESMKVFYDFHQFQIQYLYSITCNFIQLYMSLSLRRKTQLKFDSKIKSLQKKIKTLQLPKLQRSKVDDLNKFLKDPMTLQKQQSNEIQQAVDFYENVQPWMEVTEDSDILRQQKNIRAEINILLADQISSGKQYQKSPQSAKKDHKKIQIKLKKFQPINSSFSIFYGQKKLTQEYNQKNNPDHDQQSKKGINLPDLTKLKSFSKQYNKTSQKPFFDSLQRKMKRQQGIIRHNSEYQNKLKYIYYTGQIEHRSSEKLKGKLNKYTSLFQGKYNKFNEDYQNMVNDIGSYKLDEQNDKDYRTKFLQSLLNKKRL